MLKKNYYNLIAQMTLTAFKLKYAGSFLGYLWSLVKPLILFAILYFVFTLVFKLGKNIPNYPVYLLLGIVIWSFFLEATTTGMTSIVARGDLIKKINFPKIIILISAVITALISFLLNLLVVFVFMIFSGIQLDLRNILFIPIIFELVLIILGVTLILSTLYTKFRDFSHIWELFLQILFYAVPILYPVLLIPDRFRAFIMLNPLTQVIQDSRWVLISKQTTTSWSLLSFPLNLLPLFIILVILLVGVFFFSYSAKNFAEEI